METLLLPLALLLLILLVPLFGYHLLTLHLRDGSPTTTKRLLDHLTLLLALMIGLLAWLHLHPLRDLLG